MEIRIIENFFEILIIVFEISLPEVCNLVKNWYIFLIFEQNFNVCISSKLSGVTDRVLLGGILPPPEKKLSLLKG